MTTTAIVSPADVIAQTLSRFRPRILDGRVVTCCVPTDDHELNIFDVLLNELDQRWEISAVYAGPSGSGRGSEFDVTWEERVRA